MLKYEAIRFDPTPGEVVDLLTESVEATNRRCRTRLLEDNPVKWRKVARRYQKTPDGWDMWRAGRGGVPASQVAFSWWTDLEGRKHAVIRGRRCESYGDRSYLDRKTLEGYPPLWHCYPDRMYFRYMHTGGDWIAVCDCGATGPPGTIGWMGKQCGPCHDRMIERGETFNDASLRTVFTGARSEICQVAISPDGNGIAGSDLVAVHVWSRDSSSHRSVRIDQNFITNCPLAFSADSKSLIPSHMIRNDELIGLELEGDAIQEKSFTNHHYTPRAILPWVDGTICRVWRDGLDWIDPETRLVQRRTLFPIGEAIQVFPSHDCSRLFIRVGNHCTIIDPTDGQILVRPEISDRDGFLYRNEYPVFFSHSADYRRIAIGLHHRINLIDGITGRLLNSRLNPLNPFVPRSGTMSVTGVAFDPSGEFLYVCGFDGSIVVYRVADLVPLAVFRWHISYVRTFAANPERTILATGGSEGVVKLWPIDRLLTTIIGE
ncbi:MAG: hypothetical protein U0798_08370 [Gemmataceae bacterium]